MLGGQSWQVKLCKTKGCVPGSPFSLNLCVFCALSVKAFFFFQLSPNRSHAQKIRATRFDPRRPLLIDSRSCCFSLPFTRSRFGFTLAAPGEFPREAPLWDSPHDLGSVLPRPHHLKVPQSPALPLSFASTRFHPCCREPRREAFSTPDAPETCSVLPSPSPTHRIVALFLRIQPTAGRLGFTLAVSCELNSEVRTSHSTRYWLARFYPCRLL